MPSLKDVSYENKLKGTGATWALLFVDLNSDGGDDLLIGADFGMSALYKNLQNGKFILYTEQSGIDIPATAMGFDAADFDGDLDLDYCQTNFGPNFIFEQTGDLTFENIGLQNGMEFGVAAKSVSWDCNFLDVDLDGDLDLWFSSGNINLSRHTRQMQFISTMEQGNSHKRPVVTRNYFHLLAKQWVPFGLILTKMAT